MYLKKRISLKKKNDHIKDPDAFSDHIKDPDAFSDHIKDPDAFSDYIKDHIKGVIVYILIN